MGQGISSAEVTAVIAEDHLVDLGKLDGGIPEDTKPDHEQMVEFVESLPAEEDYNSNSHLENSSFIVL